MTLTATYQEEPQINPVDLVEQVVVANDWAFDIVLLILQPQTLELHSSNTQLTTSRPYIRSPSPPNRCMLSAGNQIVLKRFDSLVGRGPETLKRILVVGYQVDLRLDTANQLEQPCSIFQRIVDPRQQNITESDAFVVGQRVFTASSSSSASEYLRVIGMSFRRSSSVVAFSDTARFTGRSWASRYMLGTMPAVETVTRR